MSVLLELNDTLDTLRESPVETDDGGTPPFVLAPAAAEERQVEAARPAQPTSEGQRGDRTLPVPTLETHIAPQTAREEVTPGRGRNSI
ncbi:uncharacterized protein LOC108876246, partial [Scomber scombrus]